MRRKYLRFEQMEVFRPMPLPEAMKSQIKQESEDAKKLANSLGDKKLPEGSKQ